MKKTIAVLPGDGIGPEVITQGVKIIEKIGKIFGHQFILEKGLIGGEAIDKKGGPLPKETLALCRKSDAVLLGAVGGPKWENLNPNLRPEAGLLKLRQELVLFANIRPIKVYPQLRSISPIKNKILDRLEIIFFRELTGGIYFGKPKGRKIKDKIAIDTSIYSQKEIERIARLAFKQALKRKKKLTSVDKANVLATSQLWREVVNLVSKDFPEVLLEHFYVDSFAMQLIKKPFSFDVVLTENMFGDILTDEAAVLSGSIGLLPSASLGKNNLGLYEPIHGSAPKLKGLNKANPIGTILSVALMLRYSFNLEEEARTIEKGVEKTLKSGFRTYDIMEKGRQLVSTSRITQQIIKNL